MEYPPQIQKLLEKYWAAETTVAEENELRSYFLMHRDSVDPTAAYFLMLQEDSEVEAPAPPPAITEPRVIPMWKRAMSIAAAVAVLILAGIFVQNQLNRTESVSGQANIQNVEDADEAYLQAKQALLLVSRKLNDSQSKASTEMKKVEPYTTILK